MAARAAIFAVKWPDGRIDRVDINEYGTIEYSTGKCREHIRGQWWTVRTLLQAVGATVEAIPTGTPYPYE